MKNYAVCFQPGFKFNPPFIGIIIREAGTRLILEVEGESVNVFKPACLLFKRKADAIKCAKNNARHETKQAKRKRTGTV